MSRIQIVSPKQDTSPAFPGGIDLVRLGQPQQVPLSRKDLAEAFAESCSQIAGLAGFFGDDQDCHGDSLVGIVPETNRSVADIQIFLPKSGLAS